MSDRPISADGQPWRLKECRQCSRLLPMDATCNLLPMDANCNCQAQSFAGYSLSGPEVAAPVQKPWYSRIKIAWWPFAVAWAVTLIWAYDASAQLYRCQEQLAIAQHAMKEGVGVAMRYGYMRGAQDGAQKACEALGAQCDAELEVESGLSNTEQ